MEWSFSYSGPREPTPSPFCTSCRCAQTKECPTHAKGFALGCAHCEVAQGKPCQGHWGLEAALEACPVSTEAKDDFMTAQGLILNESSIQDAKNVMITARGSRVGPIREFALMIRPI